MKSFWLALRIGLVFALLMALVLLASFRLFSRVAGSDLVTDHVRLMAYEGVWIAQETENLLAANGGRLDTPSLLGWIRGESAALGVLIGLEGPDGREILALPGTKRRSLRSPPSREVSLAGRRIRVVGPPYLELRIPLVRGGESLGTLRVGSRYRDPEIHREFAHGLLVLGSLVLLAVGALALVLTRPLRTMSRSMDRVATGDLDHRVKVKGRGEVATMGESFNAMTDRVAQMLRSQRELLAGVSHELRSPLARMRMELELLRGQGVEETRIADLEAEVETVDALVAELLAASRLELGAGPELREVGIGEAAEEAWRRVAESAEERGMALRCELAEGAKTVFADTELLRRVLGNLFENAVRYAGEGEVLLTSRRIGERVELRVADRGPGVPAEDLGRLFEPFFRSDPSRSRRTGASGLGLMVVQRAVEGHGGKVAARRAVEGGLEVAFDLPGRGDGEEGIR